MQQLTNGTALTPALNAAKEELFDALVREKMMTQEVADTLKQRYAILLVQRSFLGRMLDKILFKTDKEKDQHKVVVVKLV
jgi:hypothetical protein